MTGATNARITAERFDGVVFDMDGVITDTATVHARAWKRTFDLFLADWSVEHSTAQAPFDESDYLKYVDGKHRDDGVESFLASRGIELPRGSATDPPDRQSVWGVANRKNLDFQHTLAEDGVHAFESSVDLVRCLQEEGIGTAVISASRNCQQVLDAAGIGGLFTVRVDGIEAERLALPGKPSPAVFVEAARRLGTTPKRAAVVEDAMAGVAAGRAGGFALVIGVDRTGHGEQLRSAGADVVVHDLAEVRVGAGHP
jgi:alpha,alpha-trehalase